MNKYILIVVALVLIFAGLFLIGKDKPQTGEELPPASLIYGEVSLGLNQEGRFEDIKLTPVEVAEDSRCAQDVICVWAGTFKVKVLVEANSGTTMPTVELNKSVQVSGFEIKLLSVEPYPKAGLAIKVEEYRLIFNVEKAEGSSVVNPSNGKCYVGGCSSQICSDSPDVISTCEYIEEYACYKTARCERQSDGQCGWTETSTLKMCLENAR
jgi:hypothetical protein